MIKAIFKLLINIKQQVIQDSFHKINKIKINIIAKFKKIPKIVQIRHYYCKIIKIIYLDTKVINKTQYIQKINNFNLINNNPLHHLTFLLLPKIDKFHKQILGLMNYGLVYLLLFK